MIAITLSRGIGMAVPSTKPDASLLLEAGAPHPPSGHPLQSGD